MRIYEVKLRIQRFIFVYQKVSPKASAKSISLRLKSLLVGVFLIFKILNTLLVTLGDLSVDYKKSYPWPLRRHFPYATPAGDRCRDAYIREITAGADVG